MEEIDVRARTVKLFGRDLQRDTLMCVCKASFGCLFIINLLGLPYIMPFFKKYSGAPFLPSKHHSISGMLDNLPVSAARKSGERVLLDFGSGDGRIVFAAAKRGFSATGIELNPWLYAYSYLRSYRLGGKFVLGNMWTKGPAIIRDTSPDVVTIYGLPGPVVAKFAEILSENLDKNKETIIVSNYFKIPKMRELGSFGDFYFYQI